MGKGQRFPQQKAIFLTPHSMRSPEAVSDGGSTWLIGVTDLNGPCSVEYWSIFNGVGFWLKLGLGGAIRFEKAHTHTPYGENYNNLGRIVVHFGAPVKSWGGFS